MEILQQLFERQKELVYLEEPIKNAVHSILNSFKADGKMLICGNGGSSSDTQHIVGELMKAFELQRPLNKSLQEKLKKQYGKRGVLLAEKLQQGLPAISLSAHAALLTAISNDLGGDFIFAQQVAGYGKPGDVLLAISTSGNAQNVIDALITAKAKNLITIGLTGESGGIMKTYCDILINVPETKTACIQEIHLPVLHVICRLIEMELFGR